MIFFQKYFQNSFIDFTREPFRDSFIDPSLIFYSDFPRITSFTDYSQHCIRDPCRTHPGFSSGVLLGISPGLPPSIPPGIYGTPSVTPSVISPWVFCHSVRYCSQNYSRILLKFTMFSEILSEICSVIPSLILPGFSVGIYLSISLRIPPQILVIIFSGILSEILPGMLFHKSTNLNPLWSHHTTLKISWSGVNFKYAKAKQRPNNPLGAPATLILWTG